MANSRLVSFIKSSRSQGKTNEEIKQKLISVGWDQEDVVSALQDRDSSQEIAVPQPDHKSKFSLSNILLTIGGVITVLAAVTYIGLNWQDWGSFGHIIAITIPTVLCYATGSVIYQRGKQELGTQIVVVGSLLFPALLTVIFKELSVFVSNPDIDKFVFLVSLSSLAAYILSSKIFKDPIWILLELLASIPAYYSGLVILGVPGLDLSINVNYMAWLLLLLSIFQYALSHYFFTKNQIKESRYSLVVGTITTIVSLIFISGEAYSYSSYTWILLILGLAYFAYGCYAEKYKNNDLTRVVYLLGSILVFYNLSKVYGLIISTSQDTTSYSTIRDYSSITQILTGLSFVAAANIGKKINLSILKSYLKLFDLLGTFYTLVGVAILGTGDHRPVAETALLISSLSVIGLSIPRKDKIYLLIGTIFLIAYIFGIGGEYFQDQVGWPITLFVTGLTSMGVGVLLDNVRKKYFKQKVEDAKNI